MEKTKKAYQIWIKKTGWLLVLAMFWVLAMGCAEPDYLPDTSNLLDVKMNILDTTTGIGEDFTIIVTLTNNTGEVMPVSMYSSYWSDLEVVSSTLSYMPKTWNFSLGPNQKAMLILKGRVWQFLDFYKVGDDYYADFNLTVHFDRENPDFNEEVIDESNYIYQRIYYMERTQSVPLKISNLNDGSKLAQLEVLDPGSLCYFYVPLAPNFDVHKEYIGDSENYKNIIINLSEYTLENVLRIDPVTYNGYEDSYYCGEVSASETSEVYSTCCFEYDRNEIPKTVTSLYRFTFVANGEYYAISREQERETKILDPPNIRVVVEPYKEINGLIYYTADVTNASGKTYDLFFDPYNIFEVTVDGCWRNYVDYQNDYGFWRNGIYLQQNITKNFKPGQTVRFIFSDMDEYEPFEFVHGFVDGDAAFIWELFYDDLYDYSYNYYWGPISLEKGPVVLDAYTPQPLIVSPDTTDEEIDAILSLVGNAPPEEAPTPSPTPTLAPTLAPTPTPEATTVADVKSEENSEKPNSGWLIVLGGCIVILGVGGYFVYRDKRKKDKL